MLMMGTAGFNTSPKIDESSENTDHSYAIYLAPTGDFNAERDVAVSHTCAESDV